MLGPSGAGPAPFQKRQNPSRSAPPVSGATPAVPATNAPARTAGAIAQPGGAQRPVAGAVPSQAGQAIAPASAQVRGGPTSPQALAGGTRAQPGMGTAPGQVPQGTVPQQAGRAPSPGFGLVSPEGAPQIPGFVTTKLLGRGGMGEVWLADKMTQADVTVRCVIKTIIGAQAQDPYLRELFLDEARIIAQLRHSNVVSVIDVGVFGDSLYLAMEFVEGMDASGLSDFARSQRGQIPMPHVLYIMRETLQGLHHAHTALDREGRPLHIVHRDISPGNILISRQGAVKLSDFGVAVGTVARNEENAKSLAGKPHYFAPELWKGSQSSVQSDIFAMGVTFFEMMTGRPLFSRQLKMLEIYPVALRFHPRQLLESDLTFPDGIEPILLRSLAPEPAERYATALEFLEDINDYAYEAGIRLLDAHFSRYIERVMEARAAARAARG